MFTYSIINTIHFTSTKKNPNKLLEMTLIRTLRKYLKRL